MRANSTSLLSSAFMLRVSPIGGQKKVRWFGGAEGGVMQQQQQTLNLRAHACVTGDGGARNGVYHTQFL